MEDDRGGEEMGNTAVVELTQEEAEKEIKKAEEIIRPELNIEKHADFIFAPSHSRNLHKPRSRTWLETRPDGTKVRASILIEPFRGKTPTTKTRKVYLALQKLTEEKGWNDEEKTLFSTNEIANIIGWQWAGKKTMKETHDELLRARWSPIFWEHSFVNEKGERITIKDSFSLLDHLKVFEKHERTKNQLFLSLSSFRFHEEIRKNLKANHTKPTNLTALEIQGEIASVLYARLDIIMADKTHYERNTTALFQDLFLEGEEYRYPRGRKRTLEKAIKELEGKPISTGVLHLALSKTTDGKDWKLVVTKAPFTKTHPRVHIPERVGEANPPEAIPYLVADLAALIGSLEKNRRFYELIFKTYHTDLVYQAMAEWKADGGREARNPCGYFVAILHRLAHERGKLWLFRQCPEYCKHRPERTSYGLTDNRGM